MTSSFSFFLLLKKKVILALISIYIGCFNPPCHDLKFFLFLFACVIYACQQRSSRCHFHFRVKGECDLCLERTMWIKNFESYKPHKVSILTWTCCISAFSNSCCWKTTISSLLFRTCWNIFFYQRRRKCHNSNWRKSWKLLSHWCSEAVI